MFGSIPRLFISFLAVGDEQARSLIISGVCVGAQVVGDEDFSEGKAVSYTHLDVYKRQVLHWGRFSGFGSYSYIVGNCWLPVVGGLLLGSESGVAVGPGGTLMNTQLTGHLPDSQDQRQTIRARVRCV